LAKVIKNTTGSPITLSSAGVTLLASSSRTLSPQEYLLWASAAVLAEITPYIQAGSIVINDGTYDLSGTSPTLADSYALLHLRYTDAAFNIRFLSDPERVNGFVSKTVQEAIEEAAGGAVTGIAPTITVGAVTAIAYSETLADNTAYQFEVTVVARRTDASGTDADFMLLAKVKRESAGVAVIGDVFQVKKNSTDPALRVDLLVSGNDFQVQVTGSAGKTIKWQPQIERNDVS